MERIYLDHSATTPVDPRVADVMMGMLTETWGNPSSPYAAGREVKELLTGFRNTFGDILNVSPDTIFFTSGGTEADNMALMGSVDPGDHLITTTYEHHAVLNTAKHLEMMGVEVTFVNPDKYGFVSADSIAEAIKSNTRLISVMHVNNEVGTINPIGEIAELAHSKSILFHVDAVQSFGKLRIDLSEMPIDLLSMSGHKIYGPKGIGALFVRDMNRLKPRSFGGHQEKAVRAGTENLPGIAGFAKAAELCYDTIDEDTERIGKLRDRLHESITSQLPDVILNGHPTERLYSICNLAFPEIEAETILLTLDEEGIAVSTGSACSSDSTEPSHVLTAMGIAPEMAHSSIRFSLGHENTEAEIDRAVNVTVEVVKRLKSMVF